MNEEPWKFLENYGRSLVKKGAHLYVISGPVGSGGSGEIRATKTRPAIPVSAKSIAQGKVNVPAYCWKVIVVVPPGPGSDLSRIDANTRVISVLMPNQQNTGLDWTKFRTSPAEIEKRTHLHFFTTLNPAVRVALEKQVDSVTVAKPVTPKKKKA